MRFAPEPKIQRSLRCCRTLILTMFAASWRVFIKQIQAKLEESSQNAKMEKSFITLNIYVEYFEDFKFWILATRSSHGERDRKKNISLRHLFNGFQRLFTRSNRHFFMKILKNFFHGLKTIMAIIIGPTSSLNCRRNNHWNVSIQFGRKNCRPTQRVRSLSPPSRSPYSC